MALALNPRSAGEARRWAASVCHELGRPDLAASAELAISELVTNALLHAAPPISVSVHGTAEHPRFEVSDGSTTPPVPHPRKSESDQRADHDADHLSTIGRGLKLVAMSSSVWGAYIHDGGKSVWFEPIAGFNETPRFLGELRESTFPSADGTPADDAIDILLPAFPVDQYVDWLRHFRDLQRELRLLALAHEATYPMARELSDFLALFTRQLRRAGALQDPIAHLDSDGALSVAVSPELADSLEQMVGVLELADAFCRNERMLTPPTSAANRAFQQWLFGQVIGQLRGGSPVAWSAPEPVNT